MSKPTLLALQIGPRLRDLRHIRGLTQTQLAQRAKMSSSDVSRAEIGARTPTLPTLRRIAQALRVGVGDLLDIEANALPAELAVLLADLRAAPPEVRQVALETINRHLTTAQTKGAKAKGKAKAKGQKSGGGHVL